ncbi:hypothetical protein BH10PAT2_BH10PAT2_0730 [soil metagenome]
MRPIVILYQLCYNNEVKNYPVSLARAFLHRQFRSIRQLLVGKPVNTAQLLAKRATALIPTHFYSHQKLVKIIFERKKPLIPINKHIDMVDVFAPTEAEASIITADDLRPVDSISAQSSSTEKKKNTLRAFLFGGIIIACLAILAYLFIPTIYYTLFPGDAIPIETDADGTPLGGNFRSGSARVSSKVSIPVYDANLPEGNWLIIPKIGVKTEILESAKPDDSLSKGVWRVPDFGTVTDLSKPMILAAHRYGWKAWWENGNQYWRYHSFYLLPKLQQGDIIEVISDHRKYVYEVYAGEQGEEISDYNADLILYTCKFLDSPLRYFRYARLVDPNNPAALSSK